MKKENTDNFSSKHESGAASGRPYQAPAILSRERLESAANVCTGFGLKTQPGAPAPGGGLCGQAGTNS